MCSYILTLIYALYVTAKRYCAWKPSEHEAKVLLARCTGILPTTESLLINLININTWFCTVFSRKCTFL